ncbi:MAG: hypothetical protein HZB16_00175 [Armatimonadetes bacterium]|nr:hypothetical protein [Armatimonadota bacterium]
MSQRTGKLIAWAVLLIGIVGQFPLQSRIDRYRSTFRISMYADARPEELTQVETKLKEMGLNPRRGQVLDKTGKPAVLFIAEVPRAEWGGTYEKYITAVHGVDRVDRVVPGLNEQGIPLDQVQSLNVQDVGIIVMAALIGGFRKSAANVLWLQNEENWHAGKGYRTVPLAKAVTLLDPYFTEAWVLTCWHLAYNMSVEAKTPDEAAELIKTGLDFAKGGLPWNSTRFELYQEIGWTYYDKLQNYEMAADYLKRAVGHPHPTFLERMIAHAYERIPDIDNALKWYNISLRKYGDKDPVANGAVATITERYLNAWNLYKTGDYKGALVKLDADWTAALARADRQPSDTIYQHFRARIFEKLAEEPGADRTAMYRQAFAIWLDAAKTNATDRLARRRVLILADNFPEWKSQVPAGFNDVGLPEKRNDLKPEHGSGRAAEPKKAPDGAEKGQKKGPDDGHGH